MPTYRAKVGADGRVALPPEIVDKLNIREGAEVEFFVTHAGEVFFHAITGMAEGWAGEFEFAVRQPPLSIKELDGAAAIVDSGDLSSW